MPHARKGIIATSVIAALISASVLIPYAIPFPSLIIEDDGFFYAKIAQNIALNGISSFDGINPTSGYHLLWMGCMAIMAKLASLFSLQQEAQLFVFMTGSLLIVFATTLTFFKDWEYRLLALSLTLICSLLMEVNLLVALLLTLSFWFSQESSDQRPPAAILIAVALIPLTRIDATIFLLPPLLYMALQNRHRQALWVSASMAAGLIAQLFAMKLFFGEWFSVSSQIKASNATHTIYMAKNLLQHGPDYTLRNAMAIALLVAATITSLKSRNHKALTLTASIAAFYMAHLLFSYQRHWYFLPIYLPALYIIAITTRGGNTRILQKLATTASVLIALIFGLAFQILHTKDRTNSMFFATRANELLRPDDIVYQVDGSGWTGYFLNAHLINGDGLVNTYDYARRLKAQQLDGYLEDSGARYIITNRKPAGEYLVNIGGLKVKFSETELLASTPFESDYRYGAFALYKIKDQPTTTKQ